MIMKRKQSTKDNDHKEVLNTNKRGQSRGSKDQQYKITIRRKWRDLSKGNNEEDQHGHTLTIGETIQEERESI
jgi:hypothetical protein